MSGVECHIFLISFLDKVIELVGEGSVINRPTLSSSYFLTLNITLEKTYLLMKFMCVIKKIY